MQIELYVDLKYFKKLSRCFDSGHSGIIHYRCYNRSKGSRKSFKIFSPQDTGIFTLLLLYPDPTNDQTLSNQHVTSSLPLSKGICNSLRAITCINNNISVSVVRTILKAHPYIQTASDSQ